MIILFPLGIHPNASRWLVQNRKIKAFGIDTASVDYGQSRDFQSHQILFEKNIPALENVANLDRLPAKGATVYAAPMFIRDGSGGPCRIFARIEDADPIDPKSGVEMIRRNVFLLGMVVLLALMLHPWQEELVFSLWDCFDMLEWVKNVLTLFFNWYMRYLSSLGCALLYITF